MNISYKLTCNFYDLYKIGKILTVISNEIFLSAWIGN